MSPNGNPRYVPFLLTGAVLSVYLLTTAPVVYLGDSGEFTAAAFSLGIPHNSGYPLYALIGKAFCLIPIGNVGFRMNVMSACFSALAVLLVYDIILRFTRSVWCAAIPAAYLAFTPLFWSQTASAEVYPVHLFFLALMIRLLWQWDQTRSFHHLLLFVFITGLSFGNHMQTVMLGVPVFYFIISGDRKAIFTWRHFGAITLCFLLPLALYLYLPIRTQAGAAIHWGDPDNLERFLAHVTATAHRGAYVFSAGPSQYLSRFIEAVDAVVIQYGILLLLSLWGWIKLSSIRWKILFAGIILFDLVYTVFLNIISFEVTPFTLPSAIVLSMLLGLGLNDLLGSISRHKKVGPHLKKGIAAAFCLIPLIALTTNFELCNQSRNYTAYEHAVNVFRTTAYGSTIFLDGDNNLFPVAYGRIVEGMGEGVILQDRPNTIFKWSLPEDLLNSVENRDAFRSIVHKKIISERENQAVYFAVFNPHAIQVPVGFHLSPYGILRMVVPDSDPGGAGDAGSVWEYYSAESFHDDFVRDYMSREVCSFFFFRKGESLWGSGRIREALQQLRIASLIGYNDTSIHSEIGVFLTEKGLFDEARDELEKALVYNDDLSGVHNNWGYFYHKRGDYEKAAASFQMAIKLNPNIHTYHNNLGLTLFSAGQTGPAFAAFLRSLSIRHNQPEIERFIQDNRLRPLSNVGPQYDLETR